MKKPRKSTNTLICSAKINLKEREVYIAQGYEKNKTPKTIKNKQQKHQSSLNLAPPHPKHFYILNDKLYWPTVIWKYPPFATTHKITQNDKNRITHTLVIYFKTAHEWLLLISFSKTVKQKFTLKQPRYAAFAARHKKAGQIFQTSQPC